MSLGGLPREILLEVFSLVPAQDLVQRCRLVCSQWREVVDLDVLWKRKCRREGYAMPALESSIQDWRAFYYLCRLKRNLIKNPCGEDGFNFWETEDDDETFEIGRIDRRYPFLPMHVRSGFGVYSGGEKKQLITLKDHGYWDELMDEMKPDIMVKDWSDVSIPCHTLTVQLLGDIFQVLCQSEDKDLDEVTDDDEYWCEVSYIFRSYPWGVRHILFQHGVTGVDSVTLTNSTLIISPHVP
ncbi:F-box only protein 44 [Pogona vitticeps]